MRNVYSIIKMYTVAIKLKWVAFRVWLVQTSCWKWNSTITTDKIKMAAFRIHIWLKDLSASLDLLIFPSFCIILKLIVFRFSIIHCLKCIARAPAFEYLLFYLNYMVNHSCFKSNNYWGIKCYGFVLIINLIIYNDYLKSSAKIK